jgi:hypothetical protein
VPTADEPDWLDGDMSGADIVDVLTHLRFPASGTVGRPSESIKCVIATVSIHAVNLKNRLGDVETNCLNRLHGELLRIVGATSSAHIFGTLVPVEEPSTASFPDSCAGTNRDANRSRRRRAQPMKRTCRGQRFSFSKSCSSGTGANICERREYKAKSP